MEACQLVQIRHPNVYLFKISPFQCYLLGFLLHPCCSCTLIPYQWQGIILCPLFETFFWVLHESNVCVWALLHKCKSTSVNLPHRYWLFLLHLLKMPQGVTHQLNPSHTHTQRVLESFVQVILEKVKLIFYASVSFWLKVLFNDVYKVVGCQLSKSKPKGNWIRSKTILD